MSPSPRSMIQWKSGLELSNEVVLELSNEVVLQRQAQAHCSLHMSSCRICGLYTARNNPSEKQEHELSE